ncbi:MAG: TRAP transporter small permease [Burkholderiales bacterium]|nr:TRAP transporter small permease [Burkholderiales bacterium]
MHRLLRLLCVTAPRFALGVLILAGISINVANVAGRFLFDAPIVWAEEVLVFIMIWCVFVGAILVTWEGRHIRMDLLSARVGRGWRRVFRALEALAFVLVCLFVVRYAWAFVALLRGTGQQSTIARLPAWLMHAAILAGFAGMLLVVLVRLRSHLSAESDADPAAPPGQSADSRSAGA